MHEECEKDKQFKKNNQENVKNRIYKIRGRRFCENWGPQFGKAKGSCTWEVIICIFI